MILFTTYEAKDENGNFVIINWGFNNVEELEARLKTGVVPNNDDEIYDVEIDGEKKDFLSGTWFEDLLVYLGIEKHIGGK